MGRGLSDPFADGPRDGPWEESPDPDDRPNLLAVVSVLLGALGLAALSLWCFGFPVLVTNLAGGVGGVVGLAARRHANLHGYGHEYARWGLALAAFNLSASTLIGLLVGLSLL